MSYPNPPAPADLSATAPAYQSSPLHHFMNKASVVDVARDQPWSRDDRSGQVAAAMLWNVIQGFHHGHALAQTSETRTAKTKPENDAWRLVERPALPL